MGTCPGPVGRSGVPSTPCLPTLALAEEAAGLKAEWPLPVVTAEGAGLLFRRAGVELSFPPPPIP